VLRLLAASPPPPPPALPAATGELASEDPWLSGQYAAEYVRGCQLGWPNETLNGYLKMSAWLKHM
jgi:beta-glucosidase-like glycosyl hydrolase